MYGLLINNTTTATKTFASGNPAKNSQLSNPYCQTKGEPARDHIERLAAGRFLITETK